MIAKIDPNMITQASSRASLSGVGLQRMLMIINKINEIVAETSLYALKTTVSTASTQIKALETSMAAYQVALDALSGRVTALEIPAQNAIPNVSEAAINLSILNLASLQALGAQGNNHAKTINQVLAAMRTRKEIKP